MRFNMPPKHYTEQDFEKHIEEHLLKSDYNKADPNLYHKEWCLLPDKVVEFIKKSQPKEWEKLEKHYRSNATKKICYRLSQELTKHGCLQVLRKGVKDRDAKIRLAYFKPSSGMNMEHLALYNENKFTIVRQLKYSIKNENSLDIVIFLN
jgi:type I restriction enzyme, R subunit